jgi:thioredoxin reductase (NADPH)
MVNKLIIIGSGPAGLTAAIYGARSMMEPILFEGEIPGGPLTTTTVIENFPGFPEGIDGSELISKMKNQAERFGTRFVSANVTAVDFSGEVKKVFVGDEEYQAQSVIVATGTTARKLGLPSEAAFAARGISYCATCDGPLFKNKKIIVAGGGDSAMEEALFLTAFASEVIIIHRRDQFSASAIMVARAKKNPKIKWMLNTKIKEFVGNGKLEKVIVENGDGKIEEIAADGAFIAIGRVPNTQIFEGNLQMEKGYIFTKEKSAQTNVEGVFSAGDVADWAYRQAIVAAGRGAMAAIEANRYLEEIEK